MTPCTTPRAPARIARRLALLSFAAVVHALAAAPARADLWVFDKTATEIRFSYDHLGLSRQSGRLRNVEGIVDFSPTDPEHGSVDVTIQLTGLSTGVPELDQLLRSADFFDAQHYPSITFKSTGVTRTGDLAGNVEGLLTLLGVTKPVTLAVTWNFTGEYPLSAINPTYQGKWVSGFSAHATIERSAFGMKRGIPLLSDEIAIDIEAELLRKQ